MNGIAKRTSNEEHLFLLLDRLKSNHSALAKHCAIITSPN